MIIVLTGLAAAALPPPIVGGSETSAWPAVAMLVGYDGDTIVPFCSAVLVGDRWALTAAHCLLDSGAELRDAGYELWFRLGPSVFEEPTEFVPIATYTTHPDYGAGPMERGNDAAVIELAQPLATAPLPITTAELGAALVGETLTYVGYGLTGTLANDPGVARAVDATISNVDAWVIESHDANRGPCDGDSGGPLLLGGEVIGLSSYVYTSGSGAEVCEHGTAAGTRIDIVRAWIESIAAEPKMPHDTGEPSAPDDSGAREPKDSAPATADSGSAERAADLGCACASARPSGAIGLALLAFASRRRRSRVPLV